MVCKLEHMLKAEFPMDVRSLPAGNEIPGKPSHMLKAELPMDVSLTGNAMALTMPEQFVNDDVPIVTGMLPAVNAILSIPEQLLKALSFMVDKDAGNVTEPVILLQYLNALIPIVSDGAVDDAKLNPVIFTFCASSLQSKALSSIIEMVAGKLRSDTKFMQL